MILWFFVFVLDDDLVRERLVHAGREASHAGRVEGAHPRGETRRLSPGGYSAAAVSRMLEKRDGVCGLVSER